MQVSNRLIKQLFLVFFWQRTPCHFTTAKSPKTSVTLDFVGDINFDGPVKYYHNQGHCPYNKTLEYVAEILRGSDLAIGNLESPFITKQMEVHGQWQFKPQLSADATSVLALNFAGFDIMGINNNHLNDYKDMPVNYTVNVLNQAHIKSFGYSYGQLKDDLPQEPLIVSVKGIKIGFLGYCDMPFINIPRQNIHYTCTDHRGSLLAGPAIYSNDAAARDVNRLKGKVDVIVVSLHWGIENQELPTDNQFRSSLFLQSLSVDLIIGCHPHVLQGHMIRHSTFTAFSLGNFLFGPLGFELQKFYNNSQPSIKTQDNFQHYIDTSRDPSLLSRILRIQVNKHGFVAARYLPIKIHLDHVSKCLQPKPSKHKQWIKVCTKKDKACLMKT